MTDFIETLWVQFGVETQEHIEEIELNLVETEQRGATPEQVACLFRAFHSLKGLANAMDLGTFSQLAHRSEDILGAVRDGDATLDGETVTLLLEVLDEIRRLRGIAVETHADAGAPSQLLEFLGEVAVRMKRTSGAPAPRPEKSVPVESLLPDLDMLRFFAELAREKTAVISRLLEPYCTPDDSGEHPGAGIIAEAVEEIEQFTYAARTMEFLNLVRTLERLKAALSEDGVPDSGRQRAITESIWELHDQILYIERSSGSVDAGSHSLHEILGEVMQINLQRIFKGVLDELDTALLCERPEDEQLAAQSIHPLLSALSSHLAFFVPNSNCSTILMFVDVFSRAARGELRLYGDIIELARAEVTHAMESYRGCAERGCCGRREGEGSERVRRIYEYIWAHETGNATGSPVDTFRQFLSGLNIDQELLKMLSPENVRDLMVALERGDNPHEVLAHLESNEAMTASFLAWLESSGSRIITNRSVFVGEMNWYDMLIVSPLNRSGLGRGLAALDRDGLSLQLKSAGFEVLDREALLRLAEEPAERLVKGGAPAGSSSGSIRVHGETLDGFMNLIGEMVLVRSRLNHIVHHGRLATLISGLKRLDAAGGHGAGELLDLFDEHRRELLEADLLLANSLARLQESAVGLRVVPMDTVFRRLPRTLRDISRSQGKKVRLETDGQDVKIDKAMVENLTDPLLHMLRNSLDHGIEPPAARVAAGKPEEARIRISAAQQGNSILIEISDDGRGIDAEKVRAQAVLRGLVSEEKGGTLTRDEILRFIFQPGFSTAEAVTETSGRGVGMDVVMTNVMRMGGSISVSSQPGQGTAFALKMPLSAAIQEVLVVEESGQSLALPGRYVTEVIDILPDELQAVRGERAVLLRGAFLPLHRLSALLGFAPPQRQRDGGTAVVLTNGSCTIGLEVERVVRRQDLFVKDIQESIAALPGVGGASILGNGQVVLILDADDLLRIARSGAR